MCHELKSYFLLSTVNGFLASLSIWKLLNNSRKYDGNDKLMESTFAVEKWSTKDSKQFSSQKKESFEFFIAVMNFDLKTAIYDSVLCENGMVYLYPTSKHLVLNPTRSWWKGKRRKSFSSKHDSLTTMKIYSPKVLK